MGKLKRIEKYIVGKHPKLNFMVIKKSRLIDIQINCISDQEKIEDLIFWGMAILRHCIEKIEKKNAYGDDYTDTIITKRTYLIDILNSKGVSQVMGIKKYNETIIKWGVFR